MDITTKALIRRTVYSLASAVLGLLIAMATIRAVGLVDIPALLIAVLVPQACLCLGLYLAFRRERRGK